MSKYTHLAIQIEGESFHGTIFHSDENSSLIARTGIPRKGRNSCMDSKGMDVAANAECEEIDAPITSSTCQKIPITTESHHVGGQIGRVECKRGPLGLHFHGKSIVFSLPLCHCHNLNGVHYLSKIHNPPSHGLAVLHFDL
jgi:hypothetical protein